MPLKVSASEISRVDKATGKELAKLNAQAINGLLKSKNKVEKRMLRLFG